MMTITVHVLLPYSTYYKPMGDLPSSALNRGGGLIMHSRLIYKYAIYKHAYLYKNIELKRVWAYNTSWAYNTYYTV